MEYLWLSVYVKLDYLSYINLLRSFNTAKDIYIASKDKDTFLKKLRSNNIRINYVIYSNLVNSDLKLKSKLLFQSLNKKCIKLVSIDSGYYPKELLNIFEPPLLLFVYGNLSLLNNKKIYVYTSNSFSSEGKVIYKEYCKFIKENGGSIVSDSLTEYADIIYLPYLKKVCNKNVLVISNNLEETLNLDLDYVTGVCDSLFIPEANYNIKIALITDLILEQGKEILVVPGSVFNKEAYFSNYLLRDGAYCIISKADLLHFLK